MNHNEARNRAHPNAPTVSRFQYPDKDPSKEAHVPSKKESRSGRPFLYPTVSSNNYSSDLDEYSEIHTPGNSPESNTPGVIGS